eukprot:c20952_g2_i1 orf=190-537(+)
MEEGKREDRPLRAIGQAFGKLAATLDVEDAELEVKDLTVASKDIATLQSLVEHDVKNNYVKDVSSHSCNLLRVKRGLDMVRVLFHTILIADDKSLRDCASIAYQQVFVPYHSFPI